MSRSKAYFFLLAVLFSLSSGIAGMQDEDEIKKAVAAFYTPYIGDVVAFIDKNSRVEPRDELAKWSPHFTPELFKAYKKILKTPDLDYDPILQSNNVPDAFEVKKVKIDGETAYASLKYVGYIDTTPLLEVRLKQKDGKWLLDAIGDLNK